MDENVKCIEKYFDKPIEEVANNLYYDEDKDNSNEILKCLSGMFVVESVYKGFAKVDLKSDGTVFTGADLSEYWIQQFGFELKEELDEKVEERYRFIYEHPSSEEYFLANDKQWSHIVKLEDGKYENWNVGIYHPCALQSGWKELTGFEIDMEKFKKMSKHCNVFVSVQENYKRQKEMEKLTGKDLSYLFDYHQSRFWDKSFYEIYKQATIRNSKWLVKQNADFMHFYWTMYRTNRLFMPTFNGPQFGEVDMELEANKVIMKYTKQKYLAHHED